MWQSNASNVKNTPHNETSCAFCQQFVCKITETFILKLNEQLVEVTNWLGQKKIVLVAVSLAGLIKLQFFL